MSVDSNQLPDPQSELSGQAASFLAKGTPFIGSDLVFGSHGFIGTAAHAANGLNVSSAADNQSDCHSAFILNKANCY